MCSPMKRSYSVFISRVLVFNLWHKQFTNILIILYGSKIKWSPAIICHRTLVSYITYLKLAHKHPNVLQRQQHEIESSCQNFLDFYPLHFQSRIHKCQSFLQLPRTKVETRYARMDHNSVILNRYSQSEETIIHRKYM